MVTVKLADVPADIRDNYPIFWYNKLSGSWGLGIVDGSDMDFYILNQEPVKINVKDFIRETDEEGYWYATK